MASDEGDSDDDDEFQNDLEALKKACFLTGTDSGVLDPASLSDDDSGDEGLNLIRDLQKRFAMVTADGYADLKPLCSIPPGSPYKDPDAHLDDDLETMRAIERRFAAYSADGEYDPPGDAFSLAQLETANLGKSSSAAEDHCCVELETGHELFKSANAEQDRGANDHDISCDAEEDSDCVGRISNTLGFCSVVPDSRDTARLPVKGYSFPKAAEAFVDSIKKNRSSQKLIRSKLMHVESRIVELKELRERVKILRDFQVACTRRTGRALSQKKDARAQLVSMPKINASSKLNEKRVSPMLYGPIENPQVSKFREVVENSPACMCRAKWSKEENERLANGLKQQFQEMLLQRSLDLISDEENYVDGIVESVGDVDVTPDKLRQFLPKVNWEYLASTYVPGRSGVECQTRWLNCEDPLINKNPWTPMEDKTILNAIQKGLRNWIDIAKSLGTNRTPFQCLARYQRSLNASVLKREWTEEEDDQLRAAVDAYGESNWQMVASVMEGRTGTQCSNRWLKTLHPARQRIGRWTLDEDKRLKVAATLFGPKNWKKIAKFVLGRTQVQCRERWVNSLDPSLNLNTWTEEEDSKLKEAIEQYGYCWSKVAACVPPRTDSQCLRRWKVLFPDQVPLLRAARKVQKIALISNFVDRESERPALHPNDFVPSRELICIPESECVKPSKKRNRGLRQRRGDTNAGSSSGCQCSMEASGLLSSTEGGTLTNNIAKKKRRKRNSKKTKSWGQDGGFDLIQSNLMAYSDVNTVVDTSDDMAKKPFFGQEEGFDWDLYPFSDLNEEVLVGMNRGEDSATQLPGLYMDNCCGQGEQLHPSLNCTSLLMTPYMEEFDQLNANIGEGDKVDIDDGTETFNTAVFKKISVPARHVDDEITLASLHMKGTAVAKTEEDDVPSASFCKKRVAAAVDDSALPSDNKKRRAFAETRSKKRFAAADIEDDDDETLASFCSKLKRKRSRLG